MTHLSRDEWLALVEADAGGDEHHPHVAACRQCRDEVRAGRALVSGIRSADVPEPSPLFWEHFSARVSARLDAAPGARRGWVRWRIVAPLAVGVAAMVLMLALDLRRPTGVPAIHRPAETAADVVQGLPAVGDDEQWDLLAHMAGDLDVDTLSDSLGRSRAVGSEAAVWQLNDQERAELARLLRAELPAGRSGL
jgi:hypothetical protein